MAAKKKKTESLGARLRKIGVDVAVSDGGAELGWLPLSTIPFRTLGAAFTVARVRFYTLDRKRIKFYQPRMFFDLPAIDVTQCNSAAQIENLLRLSWEKRLSELRSAESWLEALGCDVETLVHGTRLALHLTGVGGPPAIVGGPKQILLPSGGALSLKMVAAPHDRVFRPREAAELASDLEMSVTAQMERVGVVPRSLRRSKPIAQVSNPTKPTEAVKRILLLDNPANDLAAIESALRVRGFEFQPFRDSSRALDAFHKATFDLVISGVRMGRDDGLEFASRVRGLAGVERLPVVLLDEHENRSNAKAAIVAGASAYLWKPFNWDETGDMLVDLIDHPTQRRFTRYDVRLPMRVEHGGGSTTERTESVARGGIAMRTPRDPQVGSVEHYRIRMPAPLEPVDVEGVVVTRVTLPGQASVISGVRFVRFAPKSELRWIRLIEALEHRLAQSNDGRRD